LVCGGWFVVQTTFEIRRVIEEGYKDKRRDFLSIMGHLIKKIKAS
jgi:hypothetical protein